MQIPRLKGLSAMNLYAKFVVAAQPDFWRRLDSDRRWKAVHDQGIDG
jgi:hypothetical protein